MRHEIAPGVKLVINGITVEGPCALAADAFPPEQLAFFVAHGHVIASEPTAVESVAEGAALEVEGTHVCS